ncbi:hypothetical protein VTN77DRAFT_6891 [Rasamsonia byssochlamydoides]|uniref:uncharacterized protein n=1 Tax=Rasamsonia byssochlamydoides TaxID=89139 RepID=UPI003744657A
MQSWNQSSVISCYFPLSSQLSPYSTTVIRPFHRRNDESGPPVSSSGCPAPDVSTETTDQSPPGVPHDVQDVVPPAGMRDCDRRHVRVDHVYCVEHQVHVCEAFGAVVVCEYLAGVEGLHGGLQEIVSVPSRRLVSQLILNKKKPGMAGHTHAKANTTRKT